MKLYCLIYPVSCNIEGCTKQNAILVVQTDEGVNHSVCPACVATLRAMNSDNAEFFAQEPELATMEGVAR